MDSTEDEVSFSASSASSPSYEDIEAIQDCDKYKGLDVEDEERLVEMFDIEVPTSASAYRRVAHRHLTGQLGTRVMWRAPIQWLICAFP